MKDLIDVHTYGLWAPSYLHQRHSVPLGKVGAFLLFPGLCSICGKVLNAAFESRMTTQGFKILTIRKLSTTIATLGQLFFSVLFCAAPSASLATACYCAMTTVGTWHYSGLEPNYLDVGGKDIARIKGFLNMAMWSQAYVISTLIVRLRVYFSSWTPIFLSAPVLQLISSAAYCIWATDSDYRTWRLQNRVRPQKDTA